MLSTTGRITAVVAGAAVTAIAPRAPRSVAGLSGHDLPEALAGLLELGLLVVATWTIGCLTLGSLRGSPGRWGRSLLPTAVRSVVFTGITSAALITPAHASDGWPLDGLRLPERTSVSEPADSPATSSQREQQPATDAPGVTVQPGDTLWDLARTHGSRDLSDAQLSALVRRWHRDNRDAIGDDPDLIHPGQHLRIPAETENQP